MKSQIEMRSFRGLGIALALAGALLAMDAGAVTRPYNYGLTQHWSECAGKWRFNVRMRWTPAPGATAYAFASGNKCQLRNVVCGTAGGCGTVACTGPGPCEAVLGQCQQGRGGSWVRVGSSPGGYQNVAISGPRLCQ